MGLTIRLFRNRLSVKFGTILLVLDAAMVASTAGCKDQATSPPPGPAVQASPPPAPTVEKTPYPLPDVANIPEAKRNAIWQDFIRAERWALHEADRQYPAFGPTPKTGPRPKSKPGDQEAYTKLWSDLIARNKAAVIAKHEITEEQGGSIGIEGGMLNWPKPADADSPPPGGLFTY